MSYCFLFAGGHWQSGGEGPAEEVTLLGWAEVLAFDPGPRLFPGRCLCPRVLTALSLLSYRQSWGGQGL